MITCFKVGEWLQNMSHYELSPVHTYGVIGSLNNHKKETNEDVT